MPWAKLDDQFPIHRKVGALSDASFRLHVEAICWCVRNLTDGAVSREDLPQVTRIKKAERYAAELVRRGVWREHPEGWQIHDFLDYQPSRDQVRKERSGNAQRQRKWRESRRNAVTNDVTDTVTNSAPTRPDPRGGTSRGVTPAAREAGPEPPPRCARHIDDPDPPNCGACADARRRHDTWQTDQQRADQARRSTDARTRAETRRLAIDDCRQCGPDGRLPSGAMCQHRATTGAAAARAALAAAMSTTREDTR